MAAFHLTANKCPYCLQLSRKKKLREYHQWATYRQEKVRTITQLIDAVASLGRRQGPDRVVPHFTSSVAIRLSFGHRVKIIELLLDDWLKWQVEAKCVKKEQLRVPRSLPAGLLDHVIVDYSDTMLLILKLRNMTSVNCLGTLTACTAYCAYVYCNDIGDAKSDRETLSILCP